MARLCKDHIIDQDSKQLDLSLWLDDMLAKYEFYKHFPKIIMGNKTFDIFKTIVQEIETTGFGTIVYKFNGYAILQSWITIDIHLVDPYYIRITWDEPINDGIRINKMFIDDGFKFFSPCPWDPSRLPDIKKVIYNNPATIIFWSDHTKTVVQCQKGDDYDPEKGLVMAIAKKALGNTSRNLNDVLHKWEKKEEPPVRRGCHNCKYVDRKLSKEPCKSCDKSFGNWEADK